MCQEGGQGVWPPLSCDLNRGLLTLRDAKSGMTEHVPVSMEALKVLRRVEATSNYVFPGAGGQQRTNFSRPWQKIRLAFV